MKDFFIAYGIVLIIFGGLVLAANHVKAQATKEAQATTNQGKNQ